MSTEFYPYNKARVAAVFQHYGLDMSYSVQDAIDGFLGHTGFTEEFLEARQAHHEIAHIVANAMSGSPADEVRASVAEVVLNRTMYKMANKQDEPRYREDREPIPELDGTFKADKIPFERPFKLLIKKRHEFAKKYVSDQFVVTHTRIQKQLRNEQNPLTKSDYEALDRDVNQHAEIVRLKEMEMDLPSDQDLQAVHTQAVNQDEVLRMALGGRGMYHLSTDELRALPLIYFGVYPTEENGQLAFKMIDESLRQQLVADLERVKNGLTPSYEVAQAPSAEPSF